MRAYPIEWVQLCAAAGAFLVLLWALYDAAKDAMGLRAANQDGPRTVIAWGNVLRGGFRLMVAWFFFMGGVASVVLPPPPDFEVTPEAKVALLIGRWVVIAATAVVLLDAFCERWFRRKFVRAIRGRAVPEALFAPPPGVYPGHVYDDPLERRKDFGQHANPQRRKTDQES